MQLQGYKRRGVCPTVTPVIRNILNGRDAIASPSVLTTARLHHLTHARCFRSCNGTV